MIFSLILIVACSARSMNYYYQYYYDYYNFYNDPAENLPAFESSGEIDVCGTSPRLATDEMLYNKDHYIMTMR